MTWDSMIDGTGKERLEGSATKAFTATVDYAHAQLIVLRLVSSTSDDDGDSKTKSKKHDDGEYLVFVREPAMETRLNELRAL